MLQAYKALKDTVTNLDDEVQEFNESQGNEWLSYLQGNGTPKKPYLKAVGRLKKKPKILYKSANQRRAFLNG